MSQNNLENFSKILKNPKLWKNFDAYLKTDTLGHGDPYFIFGVATSTYQDSGSINCPNSQWCQWEKQKKSLTSSGKSANLFELYEKNPIEIIKRLKLLSVNTYRFSIEWSQIEPEQGKFNSKNLEIYVQFCKTLKDHDIQPLVTLYHFSEPNWFHLLGSFEKEENIIHFLAFCERVFKELIVPYKGTPLVQYFFTVNEPGNDALCRYVLGLFPPNLYCRFQKAAHFIKNSLKAHCRVYYSLKKIAKDNQAFEIKIGLTQQYLHFLPIYSWLYPFTRVLNKFDNVILNFFKTGVFNFKIPFICKVVEDCSRTEMPTVDFAGVQYYARVYVGLKGVYLRNKDKPPTTMRGICEDPEGLYKAILTVFKYFQKPILITENGISTDSDEQRARYLSRALFAAEQARKKIGPENMLGYILWSFTDNFEWFLGMLPHYGSFSLSEDGNLSDSYKPGIQPFIDTIQAWNKSVIHKHR